MPILIEIPTAEEVCAAGHSGQPGDLDQLLVALEITSRHVEAAIVNTVRQGDQTGAWARDGHRTATQWVTAVMGVPRSIALNRVRASRFASLGLHLWAAAVADATLGREQAWALARTAANPRVRNHLTEGEEMLLDMAISMPYPDFVSALHYWEALADQDGALADHEAADRRRQLAMGFVGNEFHFKGRCGATQGAVLKQLLDQFIEAEFRADLAASAAAKNEVLRHSSGQDGLPADPPEHSEDAEHSDQTQPLSGLLLRTAGQRALDALVTALEYAASSDRNTVEPVVNLICDATTMIEWLRFGWGGAHPLPDPNAATLRRCESMGGGPLDPRLLLDAVLSGRMRSIITGTDTAPHSVTSTSRFFDHHTRDAVRSLNLQCFWPGCDLPSTMCEIDHLRPYARGGPTIASNAGPACRRHNGWKGDRWYAGRRRWGWAVTRPDGSSFTDAPPAPPAPPASSPPRPH
jgi:hypothetical protein